MSVSLVRQVPIILGSDLRPGLGRFEILVRARVLLVIYREIKNEVFFKNEPRNLTFWTTLPIRLGGSSNESSYLYDHHVNIKKNYGDVPIKS